MRIIIAGDGETGTHLAQMLSVENQDIVLLGSDREHLSELDAEGNFITYEGSPMSISTLMQCGVDTANLFVAVTPDETVNIVACQLAKACGAGRCVARIDNPELATPKAEAMLKRSGLDYSIFPERLAAREIARFIGHNWVREWMPVHGGKLYVVGVRMEKGGTMCGRQLRDAAEDSRLFHVSAVRRGGDIIIPHGDDRLLEGDTIYFSVPPQNVDSLPAVCGKTDTKVRHIMITGAGRVTENLLEIIGDRYSVTVIDPDRTRCRTVAGRFPKIVVVNASANDVLTLRDEGIDRCDMFLALTGSSETNIVSCMVAREHGVAKTVARIEDLQYVPEAESLSIDKIINKKLLNAGSILNVLLDTTVATSQCLSLENAEITSLTAPDGSRITGHPVAELSLPRELTIAGVISDGVGRLVEGRTVIKPGDQVVVFFRTGWLGSVERLFR